ncbi:protein DpdG [Schauerella aestuarii]|uniref:protein DpdG n=1 Tax=Schauerella aestuarii TaxID=2511204 RepID=UPI001370D986|nr:protein DpdG [Achromobacter aestuarii]MYZ42455.1 hypothetical protein [Achromobacter aestuarii]
MTILNRENDGLPSILLTLAVTVAREKAISRDDLLSICVPFSPSDRDSDKRKDLSSRASGTLIRWTALGLFVEEGGKFRLAIEPKRGESTQSFSDRLPTVCRRLVLDRDQGNPLWPAGGRISEEGTGVTADFCRGLAWCLSQDIYSLPSSYGELESHITEQVKPGRFVFLNDTRWPGLRDWARFLGFATGDDTGFFFDPTEAVRSELTELTKSKESLTAAEFVARLSRRLPVLDKGLYRIEMEEALKPEKWTAPPLGYLSTSLSFALRRLQKQGVLGLATLADAESQLTLTRQGGRAWESFTHVNLLGEFQ